MKTKRQLDEWEVYWRVCCSGHFSNSHIVLCLAIEKLERCWFLLILHVCFFASSPFSFVSSATVILFTSRILAITICLNRSWFPEHSKLPYIYYCRKYASKQPSDRNEFLSEMKKFNFRYFRLMRLGRRDHV